MSATSFTGPLVACLFALSGCDCEQRPPWAADCDYEPPSSSTYRPAEMACGSISGGDTQISHSEDCLDCAVSDAPKAIDNDLGTFAKVTYDALGGTVTLRATAQPGIVYPDGNIAGAALRLRADSESLTISTYLNGALQQSRTAFEGDLSGGGPEDRYYWIQTADEFDAVELTITRGPADDPEVLVYEFCTN